LSPGYGAIVRNDVRILRRDPVYAVTFVVMPIVTMLVLKGVNRAALVDEGYASANGSEQAVSGAAVLFAFFMVGNIGFGVFREHGWNTWVRLRVSPNSGFVLLAGKVTVPLALLAGQLAVLVAVGVNVFGLHVRGSWVAMVLVLAAFATCLACMGLALLAVCRSVAQLNALSNMGALVLGAIGGALAPIGTMPGWLQGVARVTPTYWAMTGMRAVTLDEAGVADIGTSVLVLLGFAAVFGAIAAVCLRADVEKVAWA
jgi:ABC-2 type transport system permease protein